MLRAVSVSSFTAGGEISSASIRGLHSPRVRARLESGPRAAVHSPLAEHNGFLQLRLHGYEASFLMSTLRNLAHFLEDDTAPLVLPMEISIRDTHINLKVTVLRFQSDFDMMFFVTLPYYTDLSEQPVLVVLLSFFYLQLIVELLYSCKILSGYLSYFFHSCCSNRPNNSLPYSAAASITKLNILNHGLIGI